MRFTTVVLHALLCCGVVSLAAAQSSPADDARAVEIRALRQEMLRIEERLDALERTASSGKAAATTLAATPAASATAPVTTAVDGNPAADAAQPRSDAAQPQRDASTVSSSQPAAESAAERPPAAVAVSQPTPEFLRSTTLNVAVDGYYGYNFNAPVGRVNLLRAYDVSSNSFSLNQVDFMVERLPTVQSRFGGRVDLMFGQATELLQGSGLNEQRPQVWRNLYQAYGSYLAPVGTGLRVDFGKWASSLGNEGNYSKDQNAYSRAYLFYYLPFYHTGLRANYNVTPRVNVGYWLVNGANDTEDLNGAKSQAFLFTLKPASSITWNVNYYFGKEGRDVASTLYPGVPTAPTQPGLPTTNITPAPDGRQHIFNTYATWQATKRLALTGEADFVVNRNFSHQQPSRVALGEVAGRYALARSWNAGLRAEYLDDRGGLFSGRTQALKEGTVVLDHTVAPGFLVKAEFRRDWSNQRFFLSDTPNATKHAQSTATVGLVYWWGTKQGAW